jgi:hypothetical protein
MLYGKIFLYEKKILKRFTSLAARLLGGREGLEHTELGVADDETHGDHHGDLCAGGALALADQAAHLHTERTESTERYGKIVGVSR